MLLCSANRNGIAMCESWWRGDSERIPLVIAVKVKFMSANTKKLPHFLVKNNPAASMRSSFKNMKFMRLFLFFILPFYWHLLWCAYARWTAVFAVSWSGPWPVRCEVVTFGLMLRVGVCFQNSSFHLSNWLSQWKYRRLRVSLVSIVFGRVGWKSSGVRFSGIAQRG